MNSGGRDNTHSAVSAAMANRRIESLRRLNESSGSGPARRPLSPNSQKQRLEERIRELRLYEGRNVFGVVRQPIMIAGAGNSPPESDGSSSNNDAAVTRAVIAPPQLIQKVSSPPQASEDDKFHSVTMERMTSEQSVRSFASEDDDQFVEETLQVAGMAKPNGNSSEHVTNTTSSSHSMSNSSHHSYQSAQRMVQRVPRLYGDVEADLVEQELEGPTAIQDRRVPKQQAHAQRTRNLQHLPNVEALNRKLALQQLVQQKLLQQQQQLAQQSQHEQEQIYLDRPPQEGNLSARDVLIHRKIQQQRELNLQRKAQAAQQLQRELSERQMMMASQQPQQQPSLSQAQGGNRLTLQQQQLLLLQRDLKLKRELGRNFPQRPATLNAPSERGLAHQPAAAGYSGPRDGGYLLQQPHRQLSAQNLQNSQHLTVSMHGHEAPLYSDYPHHHPSQDYIDRVHARGIPPASHAVYRQPQHRYEPYNNDEPVYQTGISQRDLMQRGNSGFAPARMNSTRSISTIGSVVAPPPPPAEKMVEVSPDFWVRLRGADETWAAVEHDFYAPVTCFGCSLELFCIQDADFVLCPTCRVVSPMNGIGGGQRPNGRDGGVGLGFTYDSLMRWQSEILEARQRRRTYDGGVYAS
ncbi:hypothetical protein MPSEU_000742500 [Mayamaea pseudoterrestris]|nr:hypothetical protein MPSEU_000742500 [Mayamaea pseudoterrestris]